MRKIFIMLIGFFIIFLFNGCKSTTTLEIKTDDIIYVHNNSNGYPKEIVYDVLKSQLILHDSSLDVYSSGKVKKYSLEDRDTNTLYLKLSSDYLEIYDYKTFILRDTILEFFMDLDSFRYEYNYDGWLDIYGRGNFYFETLSTFVGKANNNPYRGKMLIVEDSMSIYVDVIDSIDLKITLDYESDGLHDMVIYTTWSELGF